MAGVRIVIDDAAVIALLESMNGFDLLELAEIGGTELKKLTDQAFDEKKDPATGQSWKPSQHNPDTLRRGSYLQKSVTSDVSVRGEMLRVGSNKEYARIHQEGGRAGRGRKVTIPQRRYLGAPDGWGRELIEMPQVKKLLGMNPTP